MQLYATRTSIFAAHAKERDVAVEEAARTGVAAASAAHGLGLTRRLPALLHAVIHHRPAVQFDLVHATAIVVDGHQAACRGGVGPRDDERDGDGAGAWRIGARGAQAVVDELGQCIHKGVASLGV